jgi:hypothetical protein
MTDREADILDSMTFDWRRPISFGGRDASHHATTAARMVPKGWVERKHFWASLKPHQRSPYVYRMTDLGAKALANHRALSLIRVD